MKVTGIIAEYNPFHNGHKYHLEQSLALTGADYCIVVMSGDFMQRGTPAILDKYTRARMALLNGADLVLELPLFYATGSAEFFAAGATALLDKLGVVDALCFGSEHGQLPLLTKTAEVLATEPEAYRSTLQAGLRQGLSFPQARSLALQSCLPDSDYEEIITSPNNILGIEYIKALFKRNSSITPYTIKRQGAGYHAPELSVGTSMPELCVSKRKAGSTGQPSHAFEPGNHTSGTETYAHASATAIRSHIHALDSIKDYVPASVYELLTANKKNLPLTSDDFSLLLRYKLISEADQGFTDYLDVTPDLSDKIVKNLNQFQDYEQFCALLKSKDMTYSRISRSLLHILLNITNQKMASFIQEDYISYARILGFRKSSSELLKAIKQNTMIPIISKLADTPSLLPATALTMLKEDINSAHLYDSVACNKFHTPFINEYQKQIITLT